MQTKSSRLCDAGNATLGWIENSSEKDTPVHAIEQGAAGKPWRPIRLHVRVRQKVAMSLCVDEDKRMCDRFTFQPTEEFYE
jgi:hypothetical protein